MFKIHANILKKSLSLYPKIQYNMDILGIYKTWEESIKKEYESLWPNMNVFNWDGVVSPDDYYNANVKVMFLNREAYGDDYNINEELKKQIDNGLTIFGNKGIKRKIKNRLRVLKLIDKKLCEISDEAFEQYADSYSENEFRGDLLKVAYCNIKKSDGKKESKKSDLRECYLKNREIIKEQISFFNPSIIVGGNVFDGIIEQDETIEQREDLYAPQSHYVNIYSLGIRGKEYPYVDICHPSSTKNDIVDRFELFKALQYVEKNHPDYWKTRCGLRCFNL